MLHLEGASVVMVAPGERSDSKLSSAFAAMLNGHQSGVPLRLMNGKSETSLYIIVEFGTCASQS